MRKRVRLNELRVGMWVAEIDMPSGMSSDHAAPFAIASPLDIERLTDLSILSVVIDARKGLDVARSRLSTVDLQQEIGARLPREEIAAAERTISRLRPHLNAVLSDAARGSLSCNARGMEIAEQIEFAALSNANALLGLLRLKNRDNETFLHCLSVSALMVVFGSSLGLKCGPLRNLALGGLLHDIGKMALPLSILQSTGKLTVAQFEIVKTHPRKGADILGRIPDVGQPVIDIALFHHEKYDGSGYPFGIAGERIPRAARIAAICDVYDAMTSVRPYKTAMRPSDAISLMTTSRVHFDPALLDSFISLMATSPLV